MGEWTYVLAHLMLHLGLGHLQENRIHDPVWQQTCDIAVTRFYWTVKSERRRWMSAVF